MPRYNSEDGPVEGTDGGFLECVRPCAPQTRHYGLVGHSVLDVRLFCEVCLVFDRTFITPSSRIEVATYVVKMVV